MNLLVNKYQVITNLLKSEFSLSTFTRNIHLIEIFFARNVLPLVYHNKSLNGIINLLVNTYRVITCLLKSEFPLYIHKEYSFI